MSWSDKGPRRLTSPLPLEYGTGPAPLPGIREGPTDNRLFLPVQIRGRDFQALVDTGAVHSYINTDTATGLADERNQIRPAQHAQVQLANGTTARTHGAITLGCLIAGIWKPLTFQCLPNLASPIILGMDTLATLGATICAKTRNITLRTSSTMAAQLNAIQPSTEEDTRLTQFLAQELPKFQRLKGVTPCIQHHIKLKDDTPIKQRYLPRNPKMQQVINEEVEKMLEDNIIERSHSPWSSPAVIVKKKDGRPRFCIDFRKLNSVTEKDAYPLPYINAILDKLRAASYFSTIDLKNGYWQVALTNESKPLTAFTVPGKGLFQFRVMPFGLHAAPATFQRLLDSVIGPDLEPHAFAYLDDIVVASATMDEHIRHLQEVFKRLRQANLRINPEKCQFGLRSIKYLGHVVTGDGIQTDPDKVAAITQMPPPTNVRELRRFLGAASWYRRFIGQFSTIIAPLTMLLRKKQPWKWGPEQEEAYGKLRDALTTAPALACPDFSRPFILQTDASDVGIGAALIQGTLEEPRAIAYVSRTLQAAEKNYSVMERECLAIVWAIKKLRGYLEGYHFTVVTDHQALRYLDSLKEPTGRLARWVVTLQQYDFDIMYRKGSMNHMADLLSRKPLPTLSAMSTTCPWYQRMIKEVADHPEKHPEYQIREGKLYRRFWDPSDLSDTEPHREWKLCIPTPQRPELLAENHDHPTAGHLGIAKTIARLALRYYWPGMFREAASYVRRCISCQKFKSDQRGPAGRMGPPRIGQPWDTVAADMIGPLPHPTKGFEYVLVFQDRMTKWVECRPLRQATGAAVVTALRELVICRFGCPRTLITDNGTEFDNRTVRKFLQENHIRHQLTPPYTPQANPVERVNRMLKPMLAQFCQDNHRNWYTLLPEFVLAINTCRRDSTGYSAAYLNFGREPRLPTSHDTDDEANAEDNNVADVPISPEHLERLKALEAAQELARINIARAATQQSRHYNLRRRDHQYFPGDKVMRREHPLSSALKGVAAKLSPRYSGPWTVTRRVSPLTYDLHDANKRKLRGIHVKDLKPAFTDHDKPPAAVANAAPSRTTAEPT